MNGPAGSCRNPTSITRRAVVVAAAGSGCGGFLHRGPKPRVQIVKAAYDQTIYSTVRKIFEEAGLAIKGKSVVVKPNLVEFDSRTAINTNPLVVHAVVEAVRSLGAGTITIAEGPGHRRVTLDLAYEAGYFQKIPSFERFFVDLNLDKVREVVLRKPYSELRKLYLPQTVLGADLFISVPKLKTHHWVGATLSMKNLFGIVPGAIYGWPKNILHWAGIPEVIADLHNLLPPHFAIVDGVTGMEGNGPIQGTPKDAGVLVAGPDMPSVDATCCRIMRLDPGQIPYLQLTASSGQTGESRVEQIGETIASVAREFAVLPQWSPLRLGS